LTTSRPSHRHCNFIFGRKIFLDFIELCIDIDGQVFLVAFRGRGLILRESNFSSAAPCQCLGGYHGTGEYSLSSHCLRFFSILGFDANDSQELPSFLPAKDKGVSIDFNQALWRGFLDVADRLKLGKSVIVDDLVDDLDRDHDAEVALFDFVGVDEIAAAFHLQLIVLDLEGGGDL
jgi:hypothetical protein